MKKIDPHCPVDKTAAFVVSRSSEQGINFRKKNLISSMSPLPTRMFNGPRKDDLTGRKSGRFTVIGYSTIIPGRGSLRNPGRWVVRCSCGRYQIASTKAVKSSTYTMCRECSVTRQLTDNKNTVA